MKASSLAFFVLVGLLISQGVRVRCEDKPGEKDKPPNVKIKILDAPASRITPLNTLNSDALTLRVKPANISGPPHLHQLAGHCFSLKEGGYRYQVCPFHNVTQKEERSSWNSFYGVLGVWREWLIENDTFTGMHFTMGQECSVGDREVKVLFNCSTMTRLHNTSEPSTCHYKIWMDTPLACFKGAMQVYHVLSLDHLKEWEQIEDEYFADEITFQGLTKRRRKLLTKAGLLFDHEKEKLRLERERQREEEERERMRREVEATSHLFKSPLAKCEEERDQLRKQLDELTEKIRGIVKDFPAVAYRLGFLQNFTHTQPPTVETNDPAKTQDTDELRGREEDAAVDRGIGPAGGHEGDGGGERGERNGGGDVMEEYLDKDQLEEILREINEEAEQRDMLELKKELTDLHKPVKQHTEEDRERGGEGVAGREGVQGRDLTMEEDEQVLELVEQMRHVHP